MLHALDGSLTYQPYGRDDSECNYSISRLELNRFLIDEAERRGVRFRFGTRLVDVELQRNRLRFHDESAGSATVEIDAGVILGADGAGSALRAAMCGQGHCSESIEMLEHGYKELHIPPAGEGGFRIAGEALHIWPRRELMLMALPNPDGSFTVTLYLPNRGAQGFEGLDRGEKVLELFERHFPDALPLIPDLAGSFFDNPTGTLATVRCGPWRVGGRALLVGDAAHAIVPFFGQGMNCGFEDCTVLDQLLERGAADSERLFTEFERARRPNADAIAEMALDNFVEMRDRVGDHEFLLRKEVEHRLERELPTEYRSRYSMVVYSDIPYAVARDAGRIQSELLDELCRGIESAAAVDIARARSLIRKRLTPYLREAGATLDY
jgi:kynurenine 3-monooxygenase